jgi:hypothetical protein
VKAASLIGDIRINVKSFSEQQMSTIFDPVRETSLASCYSVASDGFFIRVGTQEELLYAWSYVKWWSKL